MIRRADMTRAAEMAYRLLLAGEVRTLPVDPLALLRRCRATKVYTYEEAADVVGMTDAEFVRRFGEAEAFTLRTDAEEYLVVYRADGHPARQRFTLAHELGHRALGHLGNSTTEDREADCFASHLLCPRPALDMLKERITECTAEQAAASFYVSLSCAQQLTGDVPVGVSKELTARVRENLRSAVSSLAPVTQQTYQHRLPKGRMI